MFVCVCVRAGVCACACGGVCVCVCVRAGGLAFMLCAFIFMLVCLRMDDSVGV